jgi:hypothetical protein
MPWSIFADAITLLCKSVQINDAFRSLNSLEYFDLFLLQLSALFQECRSFNTLLCENRKPSGKDILDKTPGSFKLLK